MRGLYDDAQTGQPASHVVVSNRRRCGLLAAIGVGVAVTAGSPGALVGYASGVTAGGRSIGVEGDVTPAAAPARAPVPRSLPPEIDVPVVAGTSDGDSDCASELANLRDHLVALEGHPSPWPTSEGAAEAQASLSRAVEERLPEGMELVGMDCAELPCLALLRGDHGQWSMHEQLRDLQHPWLGGPVSMSTAVGGTTVVWLHQGSLPDEARRRTEIRMEMIVDELFDDIRDDALDAALEQRRLRLE